MEITNDYGNLFLYIKKTEHTKLAKFELLY